MDARIDIVTPAVADLDLSGVYDRPAMPVKSAPTLGREFAHALGRKDFDGVMALMAEDVDFKALTPRRDWQASSPQAVVEDVVSQWFGDSVQLDTLVSVEEDAVGDRRRVAYRFHGVGADGPFVIEQQAYYTEAGGHIDWMRLLCSGFRPR